jgi:ribosomal protein S8
MIKIFASYNEKVATVVLENALKSAKFSSYRIQKEILQVMASKVRDKFVKILETPNFVLLLMKHEMSLKENKWLLF